MTATTIYTIMLLICTTPTECRWSKLMGDGIFTDKQGCLVAASSGLPRWGFAFKAMGVACTENGSEPPH